MNAPGINDGEHDSVHDVFLVIPDPFQENRDALELETFIVMGEYPATSAMERFG